MLHATQDFAGYLRGNTVMNTEDALQDGKPPEIQTEKRRHEVGERDVGTTGAHELHMKKPPAKQCKSRIKPDTAARVRKRFEKKRNSWSSSIPAPFPGNAAPRAGSANRSRAASNSAELGISEGQSSNPQDVFRCTVKLRIIRVRFDFRTIKKPLVAQIPFK